MKLYGIAVLTPVRTTAGGLRNEQVGYWRHTKGAFIIERRQRKK